MAKVDPSQNAYYPSRQKVGELHDDFRQLFDHVYSLQRQNAEMTKRMGELEKSHNGLSKQVAQGPSNTKIMGLNVKAVQPTNGQQLTYNAATGDIEWQ
jgi:hypothetical protein